MMSKAATSTTWEIPAHTAAKHRLLRAYLHQWFPKMTWASRVVYLDGFAGPGRYSNGEEGSPLVAMRALLDHSHYERFSASRHFSFMFCEQDPARIANLTAEVEGFFVARGGRPANVEVLIRPQSFEAAANELLGYIASKGNTNLAPTLALLDPFGFSGLPMELVARLVRFPACEVLINFMIEYVNRFATATKTPASVGAHLEDLFGCGDFQGAPAADDPRRRPYLLGVYKRQLHVAAGLKYVRSFEMVNDRGRNVYDLVYGTNHPAGLEAIKSAMWKVDPERGLRFSAAEADTLTLFSGVPDVGPLRQALRSHFRGRELTVEQVEDYVRLETDYLPASHLRKMTLKPMEAAGELLVTGGRTKKGTFPTGCRMRFT